MSEKADVIAEIEKVLAGLRDGTIKRAFVGYSERPSEVNFNSHGFSATWLKIAGAIMGGKWPVGDRYAQPATQPVALTCIAPGTLWRMNAGDPGLWLSEDGGESWERLAPHEQNG